MAVAVCRRLSLMLTANPRVSPARFQVEYILSEPREGWGGRKGRVDGALLQDFLIRPDGSKCFVCVCGPTAFTELTVR